MTIVDRDTFLNGARQWKPKTEHVPFPQLGAGMKVIVREMSAGTRQHFENLVQARTDAQEGLSREQTRRFARAYMLICACFDATGKPLFEASDAEFLAGLPVSKTEPLVDAVDRVCGTNVEDIEAALGNSTEGPTNS